MRQLITFVIIGLFSINPAYASIEGVVENTGPKVVKIGIVTDKGSGVCSGVFVSKKGSILTCAHCFSTQHGKIKKVFIKTDDESVYMAEPLSISFLADLALIVPKGGGGVFPYIKLGAEPFRGQQVISFGSPLGIQHMIAVGWVSNLIEKGKKWLLHTAFISPGSSGGPLVNLKGELVGVNEGYLEDGQGIFIAIDISMIREFLKGEI